MAKFEARIKTRFGEIVFNFDSINELKSNIEALDVNSVSDILWKKFESVIAKEIRQPKPSFEDIYRFSPDGLVELVKVPDSEPATIALVLFAYDPYPVNTEQIARSSGVRNASVILGQPRYAQYFDRISVGIYSLSTQGKTWVLEEIVPKLRAKEKSKEVTEKK
jgi:hypothetical protein